MTRGASQTERATAAYACDAERKRELLFATLEKSARPVWNQFRRCGFSRRTVHALVAMGIDTPERLMRTPLKKLPTLSAASLTEIWRFQAERNVTSRWNAIASTNTATSPRSREYMLGTVSRPSFAARQRATVTITADAPIASQRSRKCRAAPAPSRTRPPIRVGNVHSNAERAIWHTLPIFWLEITRRDLVACSNKESCEADRRLATCVAADTPPRMTCRFDVCRSLVSRDAPAC